MAAKSINPKAAFAFVEDFLAKTNTSYEYALVQIPSRTSDSRESIEFKCIFSKPTKMNPVPNIVVCLYFSVLSVLEGVMELSFNVESETFRHHQNDKCNWNDAWIDRFVLKKEMLRFSIDVTTETDQARLKPEEWS